MIRRAALLGCLLWPLLVTAAQSDDLARLRQRITALQAEFEQANQSHAEAADDLRESERAISTHRRTLAQLAARQRIARNTLQRLQQQEAALSADIRHQQQQLERLLRQRYMAGDSDRLRLLLGGQDANQIVRNLKYQEYIARSRAAAMQALRDNLSRLRQVRDATRAQSAEIAALQAEERASLRGLQQEQQARQRTLQRIARQLKAQRREISRLQRNEAQLAKLVAGLARIAPPAGGASFAALKGRLPPPVKGRPANRFGARRADNGVRWNGWFLPAAAAQPVRVVAAGRVVFADWLRGYGNLLIVDHGQGYMSLYGNNETLFKQAGDLLQAGDTIAAVGNSGGNEVSGLYFELRFEGHPLDPAPWLTH